MPPTPARITKRGQAWPQLQSSVCWSRKTTPSPMSQTAATIAPERGPWSLRMRHG